MAQGILLHLLREFGNLEEQCMTQNRDEAFLKKFPSPIFCDNKQSTHSKRLMDN